MRIDFEMTAAAAEQFKNYAALINRQTEILQKLITELSENSGTEDIIIQLKRVISKMDSQQFKASKFSTALRETAEVFSAGENMIILNSENSVLPKASSQPMTPISSEGNMDWSII